jgi:uncharacterized protein YxjI
MSEKFTIRRKVFKIFGAAFHIYNEQSKVVGYCKQKAFKLKEDLRIYTSETCDDVLVLIKARNIIDWYATYDITMPNGQVIGSVRRKGMASSFIRDHWLIFDTNENEIGSVTEDSVGLGLARRMLPLVSLFSPQCYHIQRNDASGGIATLRTHANIFIRRIGVTIHNEDQVINEEFILAIGCLLTAMEKRTEG